MIRPFVSLFAGLIASLLLTPLSEASQNGCQHWPLGMVFMGLTERGWETYHVFSEGQAPQALSTNGEIRTPVLSSTKEALFYIDEAAQVNRFSIADKKVSRLLTATQQASYTQPETDGDNKTLYIVQLQQGKSIDTDIVALDLVTQKITTVITQRSAQFEPHLSPPWLYYSNVHCVLSCGNIIQEIWRYHLVSGQAEQITLLNNISRQPAVDQHKKWLYFSSNVAGNYHIYRQSLQQTKASPEPLTQGAVTDSSPALYQDRLYFIRQQAQQTSLMCRTPQGELRSLPLPEGITQLRDLDI